MKVIQSNDLTELMNEANSVENEVLLFQCFELL